MAGLKISELTRFADDAAPSAALIPGLDPGNGNANVSYSIEQIGAGVAAAVLAFLGVDRDTVGGLRLRIDRTPDGQAIKAEIVLEQPGVTPTPGVTYTRYAALVDNANSDPADGTPALALDANTRTSETHTISTPSYAGLSQFVTLIFFTPSAVVSLTEQHNTLAGNQRPFFLPAVGGTPVIVDIPGAGEHHVTAGLINGQTAGNAWTIVEETT